MAATAGTVFRRPDRYETFETNCMKLGKAFLNTTNVQKNGRKGQPQKGVDVWGYRDRKIDHVVGFQCKLKGMGKDLGDAEIRDEWKSALAFDQEIKEFFILTTADNDVKAEELARYLSLELFRETGRVVEFYVWGWERICDEIADHPDLVRAFDPDYGMYSREHSEKLDGVLDGQSRGDVKIDTLVAMVREMKAKVLDEKFDDTSVGAEVDKVLDRQIDDYRSILQEGRPLTALPLFEKMLADLVSTASGRILFRITANIGACHIALANVDIGCGYLLAAFDHAPLEPKAITNKALALLLRGDLDAVLELGREQLALDHAEEGIWSYVVQAAGLKGFQGDPIGLVPERWKESEGVVIALVHYNRILGNDDWRTLAVHANNLFPTNRHARQFYADSWLDRIGSLEDGWTSGAVPEILKARLSESVGIYTNLWRKITAGEDVVGRDDYAVLANLLVSLRLLDRYADALVLIEAERVHVERDQDTLLRALIAAYEAGSDLADELFPLLSDSAEKTMLRIQLALRKADWNALADFDVEMVSEVRKTERKVCATALALCRAWKAAGGMPSCAELDLIIDAASDDTKASILAADICNAFGVQDASEKAWQNGRRTVTPSSHWTVRVTVAKHAFQRGRWREAADLYADAIDLVSDTEELRQYAVSVASEMPQTGRGERFFKALPADLRNQDFFRHHEALMLYHAGDMPKAEKVARAVLETTRRLDAFRLLAMILRRSGTPEKIRGVANKYDVLSMRGSIGDRLFAARVLHSIGKVSDALKAVYELYRTHRDNPNVALAFFVLMMEEQTYRHVPRPHSVELDAWVAVEDDGGHPFTFIVGEESADDVLPPSHAFVHDALGKKVGQTFARQREMGGEVVWTIKAIRHRYSHAVQDIGQTFESRFPDSNGVYSYTMKEDDIQPVLDIVRRQAEHNERFAQQYADGLPLALIAARLRQDPIGLAEYVRSLGREIQTCSGNAQERRQAFQVVGRHGAAGAVLDTYTAWTAATLDLLPILKAMFGNLVIPQSVKDDLLTFQGFDQPARKSFSLVYRNGQYLRHEVTRDEIVARRKFIGSQLHEIEKHCNIVAVAAPAIEGENAQERSEVLDMVIETFGPNVLDAAAIAASGRILVSEDMHFRNYAGAVWPVRSVWLQPVLTFAMVSGKLSYSDYASKLVALARLKHGYLSVDENILVEVMRGGDDGALSDFTAAAEFIGTPSADLNSHIMVTRGFADRIIGQREIPYLLRLRAISLLLDNLVRNQPEHYPKILVGVLVGCGDSAQKVVAGWIQGHFMISETEHQFQEYCRRTLPYALRRLLSGDGGFISNLQRLTARRSNKVSPPLEGDKNRAARRTSP